jgi:ketosteroid isomerase-like protein
MRKTRILFILTTVLIFSCQSRNDNNSQKEKLKSILTDYYISMAKKDLSQMNALTTPDFVMFDEGKVYNNESAVKSVEQLGNFSVTFKFDSLNTHFDKANASAYYFREAAFTMNDSARAPLRFLESATFEKKDGKWKLRFLHATLRK